MRLSRLVFALLTFTSVGIALTPVHAHAEPSRIITLPTATVLPSLATKINTDSEMSPVDSSVGVGLTGGLAGVFETGADYVAAGVDPGYWKFNAKFAWQQEAASWSPTIAIGGEEFGTGTKLPTANIAYVLASWTLPSGLRITGGAFQGNPYVMLDEHGKPSNTGAMGGFDFAFNTHWWMGADWRCNTSGQESAWSGGGAGVSYATNEHATVMLGYRLAANHALAHDAAVVQWELVF